MCSFVNNDEASITTCNTIFNGILGQGLEKVLYNIFTEINIGYQYLTKNVEDKVKVLIPEKILNFLDLHEAYVKTAVEKVNDMLDSQAYALFDDIKAFDLLDLILLISILVLVVLIVFRVLLGQFEFALWQNKRILGVLPTKLMIEQASEIEKIIKKIS